MACGHLIAVAALLGAVLAVPASGQSVPRPEHPRPDLERKEWLCLNGEWDFWEGDATTVEEARTREEFPDRIVVPFCRESRLSGLARTGFVKNVLYRRSFEPLAAWQVARLVDGATHSADGAHSTDSVDSAGHRVLLHIGACDWRTIVWLNGKQVGFHEGGNTPITCDLTDALRADTNELRIFAFDDPKSGLQQLGKQARSEKSEGIFYTRTTGIWQTVWLEQVGSTRIDELTIRTTIRGDRSLDNKIGALGASSATVTVVPRLIGPCEGLLVCARVTDGGGWVAEECVEARSHGCELSIDLTRRDAETTTGTAPHVWSPADPHLYDLELSLRTAKSFVPVSPITPGRPIPFEVAWPEAVDAVRSYFGLRTVSIEGPAVLINGQPVFQRLVLDQGFYPDGVWTAPSDAALRGDVELSMAAGFNGARLHQKVFEPRFHYWADRLGYLTWGEAPSYGADYTKPAVDRVVLHEWAEILERDCNHPSIIGWCPFNETGPESGLLQNAVVAVTRAADSTRPVLDTSGYVHSDAGRDVDDTHDYDQNPVSFRARYWPPAGGVALPARYGFARRDRPYFVSEFGGIGWRLAGEPGWGYGNDPKTEAEWLARFRGLIDAQLDNASLFGFCYTQLTDVEQERNGVFFFDRRPKFDLKTLHAIVARPAAIEAMPPPAGEASRSPSGVGTGAAPTVWNILVPSAIDDPDRSWMYVVSDAPLADENWRTWELKRKVASGHPGFGHKEGFDLHIGTPWTTSDLYLFRLIQWDGSPFDVAMLVMHYDNAVELCLNGEMIDRREGWNDRYEPFDVTERVRALLKPGANTLTVHVHQDTGGQYFDAALLLGKKGAGGS